MLSLTASSSSMASSSSVASAAFPAKYPTTTTSSRRRRARLQGTQHTKAHLQRALTLQHCARTRLLRRRSLVLSDASSFSSRASSDSDSDADADSDDGESEDDDDLSSTTSFEDNNDEDGDVPSEKSAPISGAAQLVEDDDAAATTSLPPPPHYSHSPFAFPVRLARPTIREVSREALEAIDSELVDVPIEYIRDGLKGQSASMLRTLASTSVLSTSSSPSSPSSFPTTARIQVQHPPSTPASSLPTHVLALYAPLNANATSQQTKTQVQLLPTHALVLASFCSSVPALPGLPVGIDENLESAVVPIQAQTCDGKTQRGVIEVTRLNVPIVPLCVPSPETAGLLTAFLYSRDERQLVKALLGVEVAAPPVYLGEGESKLDREMEYEYDDDESEEDASPDPTSLPRRTLPDAILHTSLLLSSSTALPSETMTSLNARARTIASLWRNACAMGVCDIKFWRAVEVSWAVVVGAASVVGGRMQEAESQDGAN